MEDNWEVRYILELCFQDDYQILQAEDGKDALEKVKMQEPDLIISDVMMPNMDGFETCRLLKDNPTTATIPIIFVTAKKETTDIVQGFQAGGVDYISKPYRQEEVISRVRTHLQLRRLLANQERLIGELNQALSEVKTLKGILPICSYCKKIRDDEGHWHQMEKYIATRSDSEFSHGICEECYANIDEDWKK